MRSSRSSRKPFKKPVMVRSRVENIASAQRLLDQISQNPEVLADLAHTHVISARQFDRETSLQIIRLAAWFETKPFLPHTPLGGKILINAFYEPSTRTRCSFASAWMRLGGQMMFVDNSTSTGLAKGESLHDIMEMFNNYGDVLVLRSNHAESVYEMMSRARIPIINAGNGEEEHPTQALTDLYTILQWRPDLLQTNLPPEQQIHVGVIGTPSRMRSIRSLLLLLSNLVTSIRQVTVFSPHEEAFAPQQLEELESVGLKLQVTSDIESVLPDLDVIYINSIIWKETRHEQLLPDFQLSSNSPLKTGSIVLHPLARGEELDASLDDSAHNWYFTQARCAVFVRMALLLCIMNRINQVTELIS